MSIAQAHAECYRAFEELCKAPAQDSEWYRRELLDEFDKYCLWAGNVGAAHSGGTYKLSLDYRLREASTYKHQVPDDLLLSILIVPDRVNFSLGRKTPHNCKTPSRESISDPDWRENSFRGAFLRFGVRQC